MPEASTNLENIYTYFSNLSSYYLFTCIATIGALCFTWYIKYVEKNKSPKNTPKKKQSDHKSKKMKRKTSEDLSSTSTKHSPINYDFQLHNKDAFRQFKTAQQMAIEKQILKGLSEEEIKNEEEIQLQQLQKFYELMAEREEDFQIHSMEELLQQYNLYR